METVRRIISFALFVGLMGMMGCGSDSNSNHQGVSFRAVGLFSGDLSESKCTVPTTTKAIADQGTSLPLSDPRLDFGYPNNTTDVFFICQGYIWLQNDLVDQAIVVNSIDFEYEIPAYSSILDSIGIMLLLEFASIRRMLIQQRTKTPAARSTSTSANLLDN